MQFEYLSVLSDMARKLAVQELNRLSPEALREQSRLSLTVLLDNIRSGNNIGSVFRTADAFRLNRVILGGICAQPPQRDILKTSLGAEKTVPWEYHEDLLELVRNAQARGAKIAVVEQTDASVPLEAWNPTAEHDWWVILGNEVGGVSDELVKLADLCIEVPQFGHKHSLNISVCAGVVFWQYMRSCGLEAVRSCEVS